MAWVNGQLVAEANGINTTDYQNFLKLSPEQQSALGALGATFDKNNSLGDFSGLAAKAAGNGTTSWWDSLKNSFNPEGTSGRSYAGNVMDTIGTGVGIGTGLAGAYYTAKNYELQKDQQNYLKSRDAQSDARKTTFASNAGNGASY